MQGVGKLANGQLSRKAKVVRDPKSRNGYGNTVFGKERTYDEHNTCKWRDRI